MRSLPTTHGEIHSRKGSDPTRDGAFTILIGGPTAPVTTGDSQEILTIPEDLDGADLDHVSISLRGAASSSGLPTVQIRNITQAHDMLTTPVSIDVSEFHSYTAAVPPVINTSNNSVAKGDRIAVDVDIAGTGAQGLTVMVGFS